MPEILCSFCRGQGAKGERKRGLRSKEIPFCPCNKTLKSEAMKAQIFTAIIRFLDSNEGKGGTKSVLTRPGSDLYTDTLRGWGGKSPWSMISLWYKWIHVHSDPA